MTISGKLVAILICVLLVLSSPALGQVDQKADKKAQEQSPSSSVRVSSTPRVRFGGFSFGAGYSRYSGYPYYAYYWPWYDRAFYSPFYGFYSPFWFHPGWYTGFAYGTGMGEIKLRSNVADADVFLDNGFAGKAKDLKTMWLDPGAYNLRIEAGTHAPYELRIYVLSGKTLKIDAKLGPE